VHGLGDFLEIETQAAAADLPAARARVESLAHALGCTDAERRSYLELVLGSG
jgi:adenylate cyclase class IV